MTRVVSRFRSKTPSAVWCPRLLKVSTARVQRENVVRTDAPLFKDVKNFLKSMDGEANLFFLWLGCEKTHWSEELNKTPKRRPFLIIEICYDHREQMISGSSFWCSGKLARLICIVTWSQDRKKRLRRASPRKLHDKITWPWRSHRWNYSRDPRRFTNYLQRIHYI